MKALLLTIIPFLMFSEHRHIYIFYSGKGNVLHTKQVEALYSDKPGLQDRDLQIHVYNTDTATAEAKQWRIDTNEPFTFLLVGKDGTEKLRSHQLVTNEKLFAIIDAMPMRKREMKKQ